MVVGEVHFNPAPPDHPNLGSAPDTDEAVAPQPSMRLHASARMMVASPGFGATSSESVQKRRLLFRSDELATVVFALGEVQ